MKVKLEPVDNKLDQLYSLMNVIKNTLECETGGVFDKDIANLMDVGKDITKSCHETISELSED